MQQTRALRVPRRAPHCTRELIMDTRLVEDVPSNENQPRKGGWGDGENGERPVFVRTRIDHLWPTRDCLIKADSTSASTILRAISFR